MRRLIYATTAALIALMTLALPVAAMDEPDSVDLHDIEVIGGLLTSGDILVIVPYSIPFTVQPDDNIDKTFTFRMLSADASTEIGSVLAAPKYEGGYGGAIVSFYISSNTTWEEAYVFRVQQNPAFYPVPLHWDESIGASNYSVNGTGASIYLRAKIIDVADDLSAAFGVELLATGEGGLTVLSTYGELYFIAAVPGLQAMCPELFSVQIVTPSYDKRSWSTTLADSLRTKYAGTFIADFMTGYAGLFSMAESSAMNFLSIILFVVIIFVSIWKFKGTMLSGFVDGYALLLLLMLSGFWSMELNGLLAFLSTLIAGVILFLNKS